MKPVRPDGTLELEMPKAQRNYDSACRDVAVTSEQREPLAARAEMCIVSEQPLVAQDPTLAQMMQIATQGNNIEILERLVAMQEKRDQQRARAEFNNAMKAAQGEMRPVIRDAENSHTRSRYARLETIDAAIRPIYTKHGFSLTFNSASPKQAGSLRMVCDCRHDAGHSEQFELEGDLDTGGAQGKANKTSIQGLGSTASYLRRYLTCMMFNIALRNEDNDGGYRDEFIGDADAMDLRDLIADAGMGQDRAAALLKSLAAASIEKIRAGQLQLAKTLIAGEKRRAQGVAR